MKVKELKELINGLPEDMEIYVRDPEETEAPKPLCDYDISFQRGLPKMGQ
ncbi:hypothetical protein [Methanococcus sp. CF]